MNLTSRANRSRLRTAWHGGCKRASRTQTSRLGPSVARPRVHDILPCFCVPSRVWVQVEGLRPLVAGGSLAMLLPPTLRENRPPGAFLCRESGVSRGHDAYPFLDFPSQ